MKYIEKKPPRQFVAGSNSDIVISDCGQIELLPDEQVTFLTETGKEYDFARKNWGYYATPSINGRLDQHGFRAALVKNNFSKLYLMVVDKEKFIEFDDYLKKENQEVIYWLDQI